MWIALSVASIVFMIAVHEFGHLIAARSVGVTVRTFNIGFGPTLCQLGRLMGVPVYVKLIPLGGSVDIPQYAHDAHDHTWNDIAAKDGEVAITQVSPIRQVFILIGGILANIICGGLLLVPLFIERGIPWHWAIPIGLIAGFVAFGLAWWVTLSTLFNLVMFQSANEISSIVGATTFMASDEYTATIPLFLAIVGVVGITIAAFNAIPFPGLDGGHIAIVGIEAIRGKRLSKKVAIGVQFVGMVILIVFSVALVVKDVLALF